MKNKFLFKLVGITSAVAVTIGGIGVYNYDSEAALNTDNISVVTSNSIKEETKSTAKIPSGKPEKEETVYIFTNAKGEKQNIIVSNHLKNTDNADNLQDMTSLSNIENVKGDEAFKQNGENIDWKSNGSDIYYQGNTDKKPPISVKVSYKLDGNDIEPDELLGKSGKVTIRYDYENNAGETKKINGKDEDVFVPFTMATVLTLPCDKFSNINVTNGKVMSEGNNSVVLAITFPKLAKSLGLDDKEEKLPEYFEITADVKDFALNMSITAALPDMISELIDTDSNTKNKLQDNIDKLLDGADELKTGAVTLKDGTSTLKNKSDKLADGVKILDSGADKLSKNISKLSTGASTLKTGIYSFKNGADKLNAGANKLNAGIDSVKDGADKLSEGGIKLSSSLTALSEEYSKINAGIISLVDKVSGISTSASKQVDELNNKITTYKEKMGALIKAYGSEEKIAANPADWAAYNQMKGAVGAMESMATSLSAQSSPDENSAKNLAVLKDGSAKIDAALKTLAASSDTFSESLNKLSAGASSLSSGSQQLKSGLNNLSAGAAKLYTGAASLETGAEKLDAGAKDLHKGSSKLNSSVAKLIEGIVNLDNGAGQLNEGVETFSSKLSDADLTGILDHLDVVTKLGKDYTTFSGADENEKNSVKFIIKVDGIEGNDK